MVATGSPDGPSRTDRTEETAATEKPGRYQRSPAAMVGALIVTLLVILAFVAFRALNRSDLEVKPEHVDYLAQVRIAQESGVEPVYPSRLPSGWYATQVSFSSGGTRPGLELSMLTADDEYVGFVASATTLPALLTRYVDAHPQAGEPVTIDRPVDGTVPRRWDTWTDTGGDTALAAEQGGESLLVFGTASRAALEQIAATLTDDRVGA